MKRVKWMLACLTCAAAVMAAGCQPTATGEGSGAADAPSSSQTVAGQPAATNGLKTTVLHAKGMH